MSDVLILSYADIEQLLSIEVLLPVIEHAFARYARDEIATYPVVREQLVDRNAVFGIKSGYLPDEGFVGLKAGGFWTSNPTHGRTAHQSTVVLFDADSGVPVGLLDGNYITFVRTGSAGAIAARHLSRSDSHTVGLIGTGTQGRAQVLGLLAVREIQQVLAYDSAPGAAERFARDMDEYGLQVQTVEHPRTAVEDADIVVTATPSTSAIVQNDWLKPGVHISAIGADTRGKQELDPEIFTRATVVVDDLGQAQVLGESQHALASGLIRTQDIHAELGEIASGSKVGRQSPLEITLFDATGLAFQDLVAAAMVYQLAIERGLGARVTI